jgi:TM2 domain-containing membrane protein YozV
MSNSKSKSIVRSLAPDVQAVQLQRTQQQNRVILLALFSSNLFGLFIGGLYEFLSLRGIVNIALSRTVLVGVWLVGCLLCFVILSAKEVQRKFQR